MKPPTLESFSAGKLKSALIAQPENLESTCYVLNIVEPSELRIELRKLVRAWQESGPNLAKMLDADKALARRADHGVTRLLPTNTGKGHLLWLPTPPGFNPLSWKDHALAHFLDLVVNPLWYKLGGPCARCDRYYVKKTTLQKTYCSRTCGSTFTANFAVRKARKKEHVEKLQRAQLAADAWRITRTRLPWKQWVSNKTKLTVKWLTRATNNGQLREPKREA
jgi:hypothetical protein